MSTLDSRNFLGQQTEPPRPEESPRSPVHEERTAEVLTGGSVGELVCGIGAVILAILSLAGLFITYLAPIAVIVLGAALFLEGASIAMRFSKMLAEVRGGREENEIELGGGMAAEVGGGLGAIVLGILALVGVAPHVLTAVAVIGAGAAVLIGCGATVRLNHLVVEGWGLMDRGRSVARAAVTSAAGVQVLAGMAAVVLGILALITTPLLAPYTWTLSAVGVLCLGAALLLSGASISARMMSLLRH
jgi:hypothetical protein